MKIRNFQINTVDEVMVKIVGEVLRAFRIEQADDDTPADFERFAIFNKVRGEVVTTQLIVKQDGEEKLFQTSDKILPEERRGAEIHRLVKKNLYRLITDDLKLPGVPYGIMHGVRPTKIIHRWLRSGFGVTSHGIIDRDRISRRLRTDYLTNYDKAQLLTEVAIRQIPILKSGGEKIIGVYVGIPFCVSRCLYCSFPSNVLPDEEKISEFMKIFSRDIEAAAEEIRRYGFKVQSIYVGGGTPTALPEKFFAETVEKIHAAFYSNSVEEFTIECGRPDTITPEKISTLKKFNVNRVCLNPQTMNPETLKKIGRQHSPEQFLSAFKLLRDAGDWKINTDLILGLPGETCGDVQNTLEKVIELEPESITLHALALKKGSRLQTEIADEISAPEDFDLPGDEEVRKMSAVAEKILRQKNYLPYYLYRQGYMSGQIENIGWCKPGAEGIYNIQIMDERQTILGVGAAASTKVPDNAEMRLQTSFNAKDLTTYLRDIDKYIDNRSKLLAEIYKSVPEFIEPGKSVEEVPEVVEPEKVVEQIPEVIEPEKIVEEIQPEKKSGKKSKRKNKKQNKPEEKISEQNEEKN